MITKIKPNRCSLYMMAYIELYCSHPPKNNFKFVKDLAVSWTWTCFAKFCGQLEILKNDHEDQTQSMQLAHDDLHRVVLLTSTTCCISKNMEIKLMYKIFSSIFEISTWKFFYRRLRQMFIPKNYDFQNWRSFSSSKQKNVQIKSKKVPKLELLLWYFDQILNLFLLKMIEKSSDFGTFSIKFSWIFCLNNQNRAKLPKWHFLGRIHHMKCSNFNFQPRVFKTEKVILYIKKNQKQFPKFWRYNMLWSTKEQF